MTSKRITSEDMCILSNIRSHCWSVNTLLQRGFQFSGQYQSCQLWQLRSGERSDALHGPGDRWHQGGQYQWVVDDIIGYQEGEIFTKYTFSEIRMLHTGATPSPWEAWAEAEDQGQPVSTWSQVNKYWALIGGDRSFDLNTDLALVKKHTEANILTVDI